MIVCLLSGWPEAPKCHEQLVAQGPGAISEVKPALFQALAADPGLKVREHNNGVALARTSRSRGASHPDSRKLREARAAAEELGRLDEWKPLLKLGTITAVEGLAKLENPRPAVLKALVRWAGGKNDRLRYAAVDALKEYGPRSAPVVPQLIAMLDGNGDARYSALVVLEKLGPRAEPAIPRLAKMLKEKGRQDSAYGVLKAIGTPEAERLLDDNPLWIPAVP